MMMIDNNKNEYVGIVDGVENEIIKQEYDDG